MKYTTFRSKAEELDTLKGLFELGDIPIKKAVKVDPEGELHLIAHGNSWAFGLATREKYSEVRFYIHISNGISEPIMSSSIVKYEVKRDERNGDWVLAMKTRMGSIYNINIGRNADFDDAAGI
jgi:hypothetical protein